MKPVRTMFCVTCALFLASGALLSGTIAPPDRQVAITIDDLPAGAANSMLVEAYVGAGGGSEFVLRALRPGTGAR